MQTSPRSITTFDSLSAEMPTHALLPKVAPVAAPSVSSFISCDTRVSSRAQSTVISAPAETELQTSSAAVWDFPPETEFRLEVRCASVVVSAL